MMTLWHKPNHHSLLVSATLGVLMTTSMFLTTLMTDPERASAQPGDPATGSGGSFDTSKIKVGTGDYAFKSTDPSVVQINFNSMVGTFVTNAKDVNGSTIYSDTSQIISLYKTGEDLSNATYKITKVSDGSEVSSGQFQQVTIDGAPYYAMCLPSSVVKAGFDAEQSDQSALHIDYTNGSTQTSVFIALQVKTMAASASLKLPTVTDTEDGQNASTHFGTQSASLEDANGQKIGDVSLPSGGVTVAQDAATPGNYTYQLNLGGKALVQNALDAKNQTALSDGGYYYTLDSASPTGTIKLEPAAPVPARLTLSYVDDSGATVKTDTVDGNVGDQGNYSPTVPSGYELASGQSSSIAYTLSAPDNQATVHLKKLPTSQPTPPPSTTGGGSVAPTAPAESASLRISYVDGSGTAVRTDTITGHVGDSGSYVVMLPKGYALLANQQRVLYYTLSTDSAPIRIQVKATEQSTKQASPPKVHRPKSTAQTPMTSDKVSTLRSSKKRTGSGLVSVSATGSSAASASIHSKRMATVTILYIDGNTGHTLATEMLTGEKGDRINFDTYNQIVGFQQQGYYISQDETMLINAAHFGDGTSTYRVVLARRHQTPRTQESSRQHTEAYMAKETSTEDKVPGKSADGDQPSHKRHESARLKADRSEPPVVFDREIDAILAPTHPGGGGGGDGSEPLSGAGLAKFFISLSGKINFGFKKP